MQFTSVIAYDNVVFEDKFLVDIVLRDRCLTSTSSVGSSFGLAKPTETMGMPKYLRLLMFVPPA